MNHILLIIGTLLAVSIIMFIISTVLLKHWQQKLKENKKELIEAYKEYIIFLKIYRNILTKIKNNRPLDGNDLKWCEYFAEEIQK